MNYKEKMMHRMASKEFLDIRTLQHNKMNVVKIGANESKAHALKKCEVCHALLKLKRFFYTEAVFKSGHRADVFDLDAGCAYEIVESESEESIIKKKEDYPVPVIVIKTEKDFLEVMVK